MRGGRLLGEAGPACDGPCQSRGAPGPPRLRSAALVQPSPKTTDPTPVMLMVASAPGLAPQPGPHRANLLQLRTAAGRGPQPGANPPAFIMVEHSTVLRGVLEIYFSASRWWWWGKSEMDSEEIIAPPKMWDFTQTHGHPPGTGHLQTLRPPSHTLTQILDPLPNTRLHLDPSTHMCVP